jgi:hypothetical protein
VEPTPVGGRLTRVTRCRTLLAALVAATVLVVGGCGEEAPDAAPTAGPTATGAGGTGSQEAPGDVVSVSVRQTGGLAGIDETTTVDAVSPGARRVLALAAELPEGSADSATKVPCCDRFTYQVTVRFGDGDTTEYVTWDGDTGPVLALATSVVRGPAGASGSS